jgi:phosphatidylserine/phosphatidylglycerophosphate/cardiolipin synthase-like enzyme
MRASQYVAGPQGSLGEPHLSHIEILATGPELIASGVRGTDPVVEELIRKAKSEIQMIAYRFTERASHILDILEEALERGVKVVLIVNHFESQDETIRARLLELSRKFDHAEIVDFRDPRGAPLHAKLLLADRKRAVVGSANLSWGGMFSNYEIGLLMEGEGVWKLAQVFDLLSSSHSASRLRP